MKRLDLRSPKTGRLLLAGSVLLLFTFYMLWQVNFYLAANLKKSYYMAFVPVLTAAALYFGGLRRETEYRLVLVYWLWYILSRILCGDRALEYEFVPCVDLSLMLPCLLTGLVRADYLLPPDVQARNAEDGTVRQRNYWNVMRRMGAYFLDQEETTT